MILFVSLLHFAESGEKVLRRTISWPLSGRNDDDLCETCGFTTLRRYNSQLEVRCFHMTRRLISFQSHDDIEDCGCFFALSRPAHVNRDTF